MSNRGKLHTIWIKRSHGGLMDACTEAELCADKGIIGNANQGGQRQVTLIEAEIWQWLMAGLKANLPPSTRRANLLVSGVSLRETRGRILQVGSCRLLIRGETKPCEQMEAARTGLKDLMYPEWRGGAFAVVLDSGIIRAGDPVYFTEPAPTQTQSSKETA